MESMAVDEGDLQLQNLESDVRQMAIKISDYRQTLPIHLRNTLDSALSDPLLYSCLTIAEPEVPVVVGTAEQESVDKMIQLKERMSRNAATIPTVVKRVRECIESINKLDSLDVTIHPAFTRRRIN